MSVRAQTAEVSSGPLSPAHMAVLQRFGGRRAERLVALAAAGQLLAPHVVRAWRRLRRRDDFTVTVPAVDDVYPALHEWVLERMPEVERKALIATSVADRDLHDVGEAPVAPRLRLRYDGDRQQQVTIAGHRVVVSVSREELPNGVRASEGDSSWLRYLERIVFVAETAAGRDAVVRMIEGVLAAQHQETRPPSVFLPSRWGPQWMQRAELPTRSLESTILRAGKLERLVGDLAAFLAAEDEYNRLSQPWHRGYLFHGLPGTGKTSVARALAARFRMPVYYLPLGDLESDADLTQLVAGVEPRSLLLLEDVDAYQAATSRDGEKGRVSIAAMLNALDGIWTPPGLVTVMTTNHREALDPALLRAGRVDVDEEFELLDVEQAARMVEFFECELDPAAFVGSAPAALVEAVRRHRLQGAFVGAAA